MAGVAPNTIVRVEADKSVNRREAGEAEVVPLAPARRGLIGEGLVWRWEWEPARSSAPPRRSSQRTPGRPVSRAVL